MLRPTFLQASDIKKTLDLTETHLKLQLFKVWPVYEAWLRLWEPYRYVALIPHFSLSHKQVGYFLRFEMSRKTSFYLEGFLRYRRWSMQGSRDITDKDETREIGKRHTSSCKTVHKRVEVGAITLPLRSNPAMHAKAFIS